MRHSCPSGAAQCSLDGSGISVTRVPQVSIDDVGGVRIARVIAAGLVWREDDFCAPEVVDAHILSHIGAAFSGWPHDPAFGLPGR